MASQTSYVHHFLSIKEQKSVRDYLHVHVYQGDFSRGRHEQNRVSKLFDATTLLYTIM